MYDPLNYKFSDLNRLEPKKGRILISDPFLPDPYFKRSVVLLVNHDEEGSLGFILNKTVEINLNDTELNINDQEHKMYFGGPVQSSDLFYIHKLGSEIEGSTVIKDGIFWGGSFAEIEEKLKTGGISESDIRFFIGYSGWESKQLEKEIKEDSWLVIDSNLEDILEANSEDLWKNILREMEGRLSVLASFPEDPNLN